ncbi:MAG: transposase [Planctomycetes bacterium GWA2_40_7]|nr:MAG: transposase [Planctomycetes bacterium GWA2_40_7]OHB47963.1 MAG: transposase [Planctomycetes bacterium GWF2_40_8]OHB89250.1 MAG: transposase [Planctomycetes bacterium RIFCSPHIGHO2_02_FULL_40_12]
MEYRRAWSPGGCFFFTVVTYKRQPILTIPENISRLRKAFAHVKHKRQFEIDGIVVLPNHLHSIWQLPEDDDDFATRWRLIKHFFSKSYLSIEKIQNRSRQSKNEKTVWQRRYWEHLIRGENDWQRHMDYIHYNPVKHGLVERACDWPYSSFERAVEQGLYERDWGTNEPDTLKGMDFE